MMSRWAFRGSWVRVSSRGGSSETRWEKIREMGTSRSSKNTIKIFAILMIR
jgi:hypothetical protein